MPRSLFVFDGGAYKRGEDSGRDRIPLTAQEAELIFADPHLAGDAANSISTELNMKKYATLLCNLAVGDELFVGVAPDAAVYRGLWMMSYDAIPGFTVDADLVSIADVRTAWEANDGDATGVTSFYTAASGTLAYDFEDGVGHSTKDAADLAKLWGGSPSDYRNNDALVHTRFATPQFAGLGEAVYIRLTVTAVPESSATSTGCCSTCDSAAVPTFQVGALYDLIGVDKQRVRNFCNCSEDLGCNTCDTPFFYVEPEEEPGGGE